MAAFHPPRTLLTLVRADPVCRPELTGLGSRLIARTVSRPLGGELTYDRQETGLVVTIAMRMEKLGA